MASMFPSAPAHAEPLAPIRPSAGARELLALRRSAGKRTLGPPGPSPADLDEILRVAARAPDHRRVEPWRFIVFEGEARAAFGGTIADVFKATHRDASPDELAEERRRLLRAPVVVCLVFSPDRRHKTPVWEQELSTGAVCQTFLLAANAAGWAGCWLTEWIAYDAEIARALGLSAHERVAGFIYLGTATADPPERPRPDMTAKIMRWPQDG